MKKTMPERAPPTIVPNVTLNNMPENLTPVSTPMTSLAEECQALYNNRKKALNNFKKHHTTEKLNIYKIKHARARRVFRESMKNTWTNYVSKLNDRTPIKKTWDMIRKITGKGQSNGITQIVKDGQTITNIKQISNTLGDTLSSNSSSKNYSNAFQNHK